jgi:hypothetical protein
MCQQFACDGQVFANCLPVSQASTNGLPVTAMHLPAFACDSQAFANCLPVMAKHLPTVCLHMTATHLQTFCLLRPSICQQFACDGPSFANSLFANRFASRPSIGQRFVCLWLPRICQWLACDGQAVAKRFVC